MSKPRWIHGSIEYLAKVVEVRNDNKGWYARIILEAENLTLISGPWPSQFEAEDKFCEALEKLFYHSTPKEQ